MRKAVLIINPTSGGEKALEDREKLEKKAREYFELVETKTTEKSGDAIQFAREAAEEESEAVFAIGGDGTVNEVIAGIAEMKHIPKLGIIPGGTGNLITRFVGIDQDMDKAIEEMDFSSTCKIDIGKCNDHYFGHIFSIGSIPEAIHDVEIEDKTKFGPLAYVVNSIKSVVTDEEFFIHIETENQKYEGKVSHVIVLLSNWLGDKKIFDADINGYGNILILKDASFLSKLSLIPDLIKGDIINNEKVEYIRARKIRISSDQDISTDVDGDEGDKLPVEIEILKQHIEIYTPNRGE